jgi:hypothetical protein
MQQQQDEEEEQQHNKTTHFLQTHQSKINHLVVRLRPKIPFNENMLLNGISGTWWVLSDVYEN